MIYKDVLGCRLSALGMGTMRLPVIDGDDSRIDETAAKEMIDYAMAHGVNYYDTAWGYHSGNSETVVGRILSSYPRDSFYIASKFPGYDLGNMGKAREIFPRQLEKLGIEYFDFYLVHNICELNIEQYLDHEKYGDVDYLISLKHEGRIGRLGFSVHSCNEVMERFLAEYGSEMDFVQLQLNWLDYNFQDAKAKVAMAERYGLPIWVMEPLRGGRLIKLDEVALGRLSVLRPEENAAGWAYRFLQTLPQVAVTLTGASTLEQLRENIEKFSDEAPLTDAEMDTLFDIARGMTGSVGCTACRYCVSHCPKGLDIPMLLELYGEHRFTGGGFIAPMALDSLAADKRPADCIACRRCEAVCPQQIKIADNLKHFVEILG